MAAARRLTPAEARVAAAAAAPANRALVEKLFPEASPGELPGVPWFRLDTYRAVHQWADVDWFVAICVRRAQWQFLSGWDQITTRLPIATVVYFIKGLAVDPVTGMAGSRIVPCGGVTPRGYGARLPPVAAVDLESLADLAEEREDGRLDDWSPLLRVNLQAGKRQILQAFRQWLDTQQPSANRNAMTESDMASWRQCQVIPYLDIRLFELASGSKVRGVDVQRALFPDGKGDPKKTLEQSTRRIADRLLSDRFHDRLLAQFGEWP